jgi:predicted P-loop ATPase
VQANAAATKIAPITYELLPDNDDFHSDQLNALHSLILSENCGDIGPYLGAMVYVNRMIQFKMAGYELLQPLYEQVTNDYLKMFGQDNYNEWMGNISQYARKVNVTEYNEKKKREDRSVLSDNVVPIRKNTDLFGYSSIVYDFDNTPEGKWFGKSDSTGRAKLNSNNVALLIKRRGFVVQHDQWYDSVHVSHSGYKIDGLVEDRNITSLLKEQCCAYFQATVRPIDFREAIDILARRNTINSRIAYLDSFLPHYDKDYDWVDTALKILDCDQGEYEREIVRSLFAGVVQRSYFPGCALQRVISLIGGQGINKSDFTIMLAGNPTPEERRWWISKNIFDLKDLDKASAVKGVAVVEYAEMEGLHKLEVAKYKADTTRHDDSHRQMYAETQIVMPRQYDVIPTTNKLHYNFDTENRRDYGIETGRNYSIDLDLFADQFKQIFAGVVHSVKKGMSGKIAPGLWGEARKHQRQRIVQDDLGDLVAPIIMIAHLSVATEVAIDNINTIENMRGTIKNQSTLMAIISRYRIIYKDESQTRTYMVDPKGLATFASDLDKHYRNGKIRTDKTLCCAALLKQSIEVEAHQYTWKSAGTVGRIPNLSGTCRPYTLVIDNDDIPAIEAIANEYILEFDRLLPRVFKELF